MVHLNSFRLYAFTCALLLIVVGCASKSLVSQKLPLISHAHIGHALTAWRSTPDEQGLFIVAESDIQFAIAETNKASKAGLSSIEINKYLTSSLFSLNPKLQKKGKNTRYGAIRALSEATDHMLYAAQSKDASDNMKQMVNEFNETQVHVTNKMMLATEIIQLSQQVTKQEQQALLEHLQQTLNSIMDGEDTNGDGEISNNNEAGLLQLRNIISAGLKKEVPAYQPVRKKYLLGMVRLSDGNWAYKFDASNKRRRLSKAY